MTAAADHAPFSESLRQAWQQDAVRRLAMRDGGAALLRPLLPGDGELIAEFFATLSERELFYFFSLDDQAARRLAGEVLTDPAMRLIALSDHAGRPRIAGYMFLDWSGEPPPSFGACLKEEAQSQGLGSAMMEHFLALARAGGAGSVRLTAHAENWRALRIYQRLGFIIQDEFILQTQGARQYRMQANLREARPRILERLSIAARGGIGVGMAALSIQAALEPLLGARPLILDRPMHAEDYTIAVTDLAATPEHPFETPVPAFLRDQGGAAWVAGLDPRSVLVAGFGAAAVGRAASRYIDTVMAQAAATAADPRLSVESLPFSGLHIRC